jgi:hypothetical protein
MLSLTPHHHSPQRHYSPVEDSSGLLRFGTAQTLKSESPTDKINLIRELTRILQKIRVLLCLGKEGYTNA